MPTSIAVDSPSGKTPLPPELPPMPKGIRLATPEEAAYMVAQMSENEQRRHASAAVTFAMQSKNIPMYVLIGAIVCTPIVLLGAGDLKLGRLGVLSASLYALCVLTGILAYMWERKHIPPIRATLVSLTPNAVSWCHIPYPGTGKRLSSVTREEVERVDFNSGLWWLSSVSLHLTSGKSVSPFIYPVQPEKLGRLYIWWDSIFRRPSGTRAVLISARQSAWVASFLWRGLHVALGGDFPLADLEKIATTGVPPPAFRTAPPKPDIDCGTSISAYPPAPIPAEWGGIHPFFASTSPPETRSALTDGDIGEPIVFSIGRRYRSWECVFIVVVCFLMSVSMFMVSADVTPKTTYDFVSYIAFLLIAVCIALLGMVGVLFMLFCEKQVFWTENRLTSRLQGFVIKYDRTIEKRDIAAIERQDSSPYTVSLQKKDGKRFRLLFSDLGISKNASRWIAESLAAWAAVPLFNPATFPPPDKGLFDNTEETT